MTVEYYHPFTKSGRPSKKTWTRVTGKAVRIVVARKIGQEEAARLLRKYERPLPKKYTDAELENPRPRSAASVPGFKKSVRRYRQFNRTMPRHLRTLKVPDDAPLIRLGKVPVVTYISSKTGRRHAYKHETNPRSMPTAYAHPTEPFILLVGGSLKVRDWLYH